jgi:5-methylthioadenosine/S-adenosylhomocysteine deaminase
VSRTSRRALIAGSLALVALLAFLLWRGRTPPAAAASITLRTAAAVTPARTLVDALVAAERGVITEVRPAAPGDAAPAIDGVLFPGLINLHDHLLWNVLPDWTPPRTFSSRYEWQATDEYKRALSGPFGQLLDAGFACDMNRFGEVKALVGGGTATIGGFANARSNACVRGLVRNLDVATELHAPGRRNREPLRNYVFPLRLPVEEEAQVRSVGSNAAVKAVVMHVAEGIDQSSLDEFSAIRAKGFLKRGVTFVQGAALREAEFREMSAAGVGYVWSPSTNFRLYGRTADAAAAQAAGVTMAIAPDWSPTGSAGMLQELAVARAHSASALNNAISDETFVRMATTNPARLAAAEQYIGSIEPGKAADFVIMRRREGSPLLALLEGRPQDVLLVAIAGEPLYGREDIMRTLLPGRALETIDICGARQALHIADSPSARDSWTQVSARLDKALADRSLTPSALTPCR